MIKSLLATEPNKNIQILIVEDDYSLALNYQDLLELSGYIVIDIANSAEVAIEKAYQLQPNLILMNIRLAGEMDGIQAAAEIWQNLQIPIIYVTGYADQSTIERAKSIYPFPYLIKPIAKQALYNAIETSLNIHGVKMGNKEQEKQNFHCLL